MMNPSFPRPSIYTAEVDCIDCARDQDYERFAREREEEFRQWRIKEGYVDYEPSQAEATWLASQHQEEGSPIDPAKLASQVDDHESILRRVTRKIGLPFRGEGR